MKLPFLGYLFFLPFYPIVEIISPCLGGRLKKNENEKIFT
jgi:hypothetical protein